MTLPTAPKSPAISKLMQINIAGTATIIALTVATYFIGIDPVLVILSNEKDAAASLADKQAEAKKLEAELSLARQQQTKNLAEIAASPTKLQPASRINARMVQLTDVASTRGLKLDQLSPGAADSSGRFTTVPIHLSGTTSFAALVGFLSDLNEQFPHTAITGFRIAGTPSTGKEGAAAIPPVFSVDCVWYAAPTGSTVSADASDKP